jgi:branched-chain amino acid transport system permease protein
VRRPSNRTLVQLALFAVGVLAIALLPYKLSDFRAQQFAYVGVYFIALIGLNVLTGYTGQISLGHGAFMAIGGYTTAILVSDQGLKLGGHVFASDLRDVWTIPIAGIVAGTFGFLFGIPALRLTGLYLALATFAVAVATPSVIKKFDGLTGGGTGINLFGLEGHTGSLEGVTVLGRHMTFNDWLYYLCWSIAVVMFALAWFLLRGRLGRAFRAVRDSELAAASSGVNLAAHKTLAFAISAFYAGVAGALYTIATTFANPETFPITLSIFLLVGVVVGGLGALSTLVVGAIFIQFMQTEWAQEMDKAIPDWLPLLGDVNTKTPGAPAVVFGVTLIIIMLVLPMGAAGLVQRAGALLGRLYTRQR